jgi:hypothetical protein
MTQTTSGRADVRVWELIRWAAESRSQPAHAARDAAPTLDLDELARQVQWLYAISGRRVRVYIIHSEGAKR